MDAKRWAIVVTYIVTSLMIGGLAVFCLLNGQLGLAQNLFNFMIVYMLAIPAGYVIYMRF